MSNEFPINIQLKQAGPIPLETSIHCGKNETLALLGPSGSGKSTVLRSISGLYKTEHGKISINDKTWYDSESKIELKPQQRAVGFLFQEYALFPHKTAIDNIKLAIPNAPSNQLDIIAKTLLKQVHLTGLESRYPHELSGGQKQRVALARALARNPEILLLDEPFSSLDQLTRRKLIREIIRLKKDLGLPIILVTHDLDEARILADRICVIHHGKTLQQDTVDELFKKPANRTVARLLGLNNVFTARIEKHIPEKNKTLLKWHDQILECQHKPDFNVDDEIDCVIQTENIILHRKDKPSNGERENPVSAHIIEALHMGQNTQIIAEVKNGQRFFLTISSHVAKRNQLFEKETINFSLLSEAIHLMPKIETNKDHISD